jgi:hypothetical protein
MINEEQSMKARSRSKRGEDDSSLSGLQKKQKQESTDKIEILSAALIHCVPNEMKEKFFCDEDIQRLFEDSNWMITPLPSFLITYFLGSFTYSTMWKPDTVLILGVDRLLNKLDEEIHNWEGNLPAAWHILRKNDIIPGDVDFVSKKIETFIVPTIVNNVHLLVFEQRFLRNGF